MHILSRIHPLLWAMALCGLAAALSAHYGHMRSFALLKPLPMVVALACVWFLARPSRRPIARGLLWLGLFLSLVGDICLLWDDAFIYGLAAFFCAHLAYLFMLHRDSPWFPCKPSLIGMLMVGLALYLFLLLTGLPLALSLPVLAYVLVIAAMTAQALGRAKQLGTHAARQVAIGALFFMLSDSILAIDRFVQAVPGVYLWVLGTYYLAQWLILKGMLPTLKERSI